MTAPDASDRANDNLVLAAAFLATSAHLVVIGGCGLRMHGLEHRPADLDVVPAPAPDNLDRLLDAVDALGSVGPKWRPNVRTLAMREVVTRTTPIGVVDILMLRGRNEYASLARCAVDIEVNGRSVRLAALDDVIRLRNRYGKGAVGA